MSKETDLASLLITRANAGKTVRLRPETALFVGLKLMTVGAKPTVKEIAQVLCDSKCELPCYACTGKANVIVRLYGARVEWP
mgnify:CR=1 FL=1|jgi:hypothetical protein